MVIMPREFYEHHVEKIPGAIRLRYRVDLYVLLNANFLDAWAWHTAQQLLQRFFERGTWPRYVTVWGRDLERVELEIAGYPADIYDDAPPTEQVVRCLLQAVNAPRDEVSIIVFQDEDRTRERPRLPRQ